MSVRARRAGRANGSARVIISNISWRILFNRIIFAVLLCLACSFTVLEQLRPAFVGNIRIYLTDHVSPALDAVTRPFSAITDVFDSIQNWTTSIAERNALREENNNLKHWYANALALGEENRELRSLLKHVPEPNARYISVRVIADVGGIFSRTLLIAAGKSDGVKENMAAVTGDGLIGRITEVGERTSRLLLITDLNSRLPVIIAGSGDYGIVSGNNSADMRMLYLSPDSSPSEGMRVLTSGHGGIFPPNLPVGVITRKIDGTWIVTPLASFERIRHVRLIDFDLTTPPATKKPELNEKKTSDVINN